MAGFLRFGFNIKPGTKMRYLSLQFGREYYALIDLRAM